jgi:hypothetical protein
LQSKFVYSQRRARGAIVGAIRRRLTIANDPAGATGFDRRFDQAVAGETAPRLKLITDTRLDAGQGHKIARAAAAQRVDQLRQEAGGRRSSPLCPAR